MFKYLLLVSLAVVCALACDSVPHIKNLDYEQFKGTWFEQQYFNSDNDGNAKCVSATFFTNSRTLANRVYFHNYYSDNTNQKSIGDIRLKNDSSGFSVQYKNGEVNTYSVVGTDYKTFAILSKCDTNSKSVSLYIMTRGKDLSSYNLKYNIYQNITNILQPIGLNRCQFQDAICFGGYY